MKNQKPIITIDRGACFGQCPIYSARIFPDRRVVYKGEMFVSTLGPHTLEMSSEDLKSLIEYFYTVDYFSLASRYPSEVTCVPETITSFRHNFRFKKIFNWDSGPDELRDLEDKIDQLAGLVDLIGTQD